MLAPVTVELGQEGATGGGQLRFCWPLDEEVMDPEGFAGVYAKSKRKGDRQDRAAEVISSAIREQVTIRPPNGTNTHPFMESAVIAP